MPDEEPRGAFRALYRACENPVPGSAGGMRLHQQRERAGTLCDELLPDRGRPGDRGRDQEVSLALNLRDEGLASGGWKSRVEWEFGWSLD